MKRQNEVTSSSCHVLMASTDVKNCYNIPNKQLMKGTNNLLLFIWNKRNKEFELRNIQSISKLIASINENEIGIWSRKKNMTVQLC